MVVSRLVQVKHHRTQKNKQRHLFGIIVDGWTLHQYQRAADLPERKIATALTAAPLWLPTEKRSS
jgi:hypothetical protein